MKTPQVLIVDDNDSVRAGLVVWFRRFARFEIAEASTGEEAIARVTARQPQLLVIDLALEEMNGLATTRRLKAVLPNVPIIIFTSHDAQEFRNEAAAAGASAYVLRHEAPHALLAALEQLFPKRHLERRKPVRGV